MQLFGPEVGVHGELTMQNHWRFEGEMLFGKQRYDSVGSGSMDNVGNIHSYWRALTPVWGDMQQGVWTGLAYHTLWNDLRGTSTYQGTTYGGYQRIANQLWIPARVHFTPTWQLDAGVLLYGRHTSKLSEVNTTYSDVTNTQRSGHYTQISAKIALDAGHTLMPYVRYTHLADSNSVVMANRSWYEPASNRWQIGVNWDFGGL